MSGEAFSLANRVVLVTGGGRGIGAAIAVATGDAGADIAVGYREEADAAASVVNELEALGRRAAAFQADVSDPVEAGRMVAGVEDHFGRIDGLVNNAGVMPSSPVLDMNDEEWDQVLRTNLFGPFYCSRAVLPGMVEPAGTPRGRARSHTGFRRHPAVVAADQAGSGEGADPSRRDHRCPNRSRLGVGQPRRARRRGRGRCRSPGGDPRFPRPDRGPRGERRPRYCPRRATR